MMIFSNRLSLRSARGIAMLSQGWKDALLKGALLALVACPVARASPVPPPRAGILVVGLGGNNGVTLAATLEAKRRRLTWETPRGRLRADDVATLGCLSQRADGPCGGVLDALGVVPLERLELGGWDVRPARLGDAPRCDATRADSRPGEITANGPHCSSCETRSGRRRFSKRFPSAALTTYRTLPDFPNAKTRRRTTRARGVSPPSPVTTSPRWTSSTPRDWS